MIEKQTDKQIKHFCIDNNLKFCSHEFNDFYWKEGILMHLIVLGTPYQNSVVERINKILIKKVRCMLSNSNALYESH